MSDFQGFSELARLYAKNASLVDRAKAQFFEESKQLIEHLAARAQAPEAVDGVKPQLSFERGYAYLWLGSDKDDRKDRLYLWINPNDPAIVTERRLRAHVYHALGGGAKIDQSGVANLQQDSELDEVRFQTKTTYSLQDFEFRWTDGDFDSAARQLALVLEKLAQTKITP